MSTSFDFRGAVITALDRLIVSEAIEKCIAEQLAKTVASIVRDRLDTYSEFGKQLKDAVEKSLAIHSDLDIPSYNDIILKIIAAQVQGLTEASIQAQVASRLKELLTPAPETIKLSVLVEQYIERLKEEQRSGCVCHGESQITFHVERSDYGFVHISLDKKPDQRIHSCEIQIGITKAGEVYSLRFANQDVEKQMFAGPFYGFERLLFQMKAAKTTIVLDCEPDDVNKSYALYTD